MPDQPERIYGQVEDALTNWLAGCEVETKTDEYGTFISIDSARAIAELIAGDIVGELGLTREQRTLADGMGGVLTNYKSGVRIVHSRPCTRQTRYVTEWVPDA